MLTILFICLISFFINGCDQSSAKQDQIVNNDRVGIYDSRCIAIAYYNSKIHDDILKQMAEQKKEAEVNGNTKVVKELEARANIMQQRAHLQAFTTESVDDLLAYVSDGIEQIKTDKELDRICSKWIYQGSLEKSIDITNDMVMLYNPPKKALESIAAMDNVKPYPKWKMNMMNVFHSH